MQKLFVFLGVAFLSLINLSAQTLVQESEEIMVSADNFQTGINRRGDVDVQKTTGKVVYVYAEKETSTSLRDIWAVIYNSDMTVLVAPFRINTTTAGDQSYPFVKINQNDNSFYVTWSGNQSSGSNDVYIKRVSLDITDATSASVLSTADITVNNLTTGEQLISVMTISYKYNEVIVAFRDQGGNDGGGTGSQGVFIRRFTFALGIVSNQLLVNTTTFANQVLNSIDMRGDYLLVSYTSNHVAANSHDVYVTTFEATDPPGATPLTYTNIREVRVNNYLSGEQNNSFLSMNETTNEFAITWSASVQDGSGYGVYAKIYTTTTGAVVKDEFIVNSVTASNQLLSKVQWEESTHQVIFFFHYSNSTFGTLKYRIFDGGTIAGQFNPVEAEKDLIGGLDTKSYYSQNHNAVYNTYTNRLHVVYDLYDSYSTFNSKVRGRVYIFKHPDLVTPYFINNTDLNRNWIHARSYGEDGSLIGEARQYYDSLSNPTQAQTRNVAEGGTILATANVKDVYNRPVLYTLPAPINDQVMTFKTNLITPFGSLSPYTYNDFDKNVTGGNLTGEVNNPKAVDTASVVGKYYSDRNMYEAYVGTTSYPYSRVHYNDKVYGGVVKSSSPGEALKMGSGHETKGINLPVLNELDHYIQLKKLYFGASGIPITSLAFRASKTIMVDENGIESITFTDMEGKAIASAKAGSSSQTSVQGDLSYNTSFYNLNANSYLTFDDLKISSSTDLVEVRDLQNNSIIFSGYEIDFNLFSFSLTTPCQVRSKTPFKLSYKTTNNVGVVNHYANVASNDFTDGHEVMDIYLKDPSSLTLSLSNGVSLPFGSILTIKVVDLKDGTAIYNGDYASFNNSSLPAGTGFYRIQLESVPGLQDYNPLNVYLRVNFNLPYSDWAYYFYDLKGNMVGSVAPKGVNTASTAQPKFKSDYTYSSTGQLLTVSDSDRGNTKLVYRKDGKIRFTQDAKQVVTGKFSYINYDQCGRTVESGEYNPAFVTSNARVFVDHRTQETTVSPDSNSVHTILENVAIGGGLESAGRTQASYVSYDFMVGDATRTQTYIRGHVAATYKKNLDTDVSYVSKTWFGYDERGRVIWMDQTLTGLGTKTIDYTYTRELLTNVVYQKNTVGERFEHKYSFDAMHRVKKVESSIGTGLFQTEAQYYYYLHGPLKRKELGNNVQGVDYVYTVQGWLKGINHPELSSAKDPGQDGTVGSTFSKDVFGMSFDYYNNDYVRTSSNVSSTNESSFSGNYAACYNGNIRAVTWQTVGQGIGGNPCQYAYTYDYKYQLLSAIFGSNNTGTKNFVQDAAGKYNATALYDLNGNLLSLYTNKGNATNDNYDYKFGAPLTPEYTNPITNKLQYLANSVDANDTRTYQYDEIGQLVNETRGSGLQKKITYDVYGKVTEVRDASNVLKVSFVYNERGQRIRKDTYSGGAVSFTTWYLLDAAGSVVSIHDNKSGTMSQTEIPIYGMSREGVVQKSATPVYTYELKDHLGNVRVTVDRVKQGNGDATLLSWFDYLPFGEVNPDRQYNGAYTNRHLCQGEYAEHDNETEWEAFELRMYDARIGRWLSVDPYFQHWSPYLAMSNNPVSFVDPDGGDDEGTNATSGYSGWDGTKIYYGSSDYQMMLAYQGEEATNLAQVIVSIWWNSNAGKLSIGGNELYNGPQTDFGYTITGRGSSKGIDMPAIQGAPSAGYGSGGGSDFWGTNMGRDLTSVGKYFTNIDDLRELNNGISMTATLLKGTGLTLLLGPAEAKMAGLFLIKVTSVASTISDGVDLGLDLLDSRVPMQTKVIKGVFFAAGVWSGGIIDRNISRTVVKGAVSAITDLSMDQIKNVIIK